DKDKDKDKDKDRDRERSRDRQRDKERWRDKDHSKDDRTLSTSLLSGHSRNEDLDHARRFGMVSRPTMSPLEAMHIDETALRSEETGDVDEDAAKNQTGLEKAMRMLKKQGWKEGEGLGKSKQGLKGCLVSVGPYNTLVTVQDPSPVLRIQVIFFFNIKKMLFFSSLFLFNMADKGKVDPNLRLETFAECSKFGQVLECIVYESKKEDIRSEQAVSVFVKFSDIQSASEAVQVFHGRSFDGRIVSSSFFPLERYEKKDFEI
ncbi:hypothetical protein RFI_31128, partial [Reticulomyxa filosa]